MWHSDVSVPVAFRRFCGLWHADVSVPVVFRRFCACGIQTSLWPVACRPLCGLWHSDLSVACGSQTSLWPVACRPFCGLWHADVALTSDVLPYVGSPDRKETFRCSREKSAWSVGFRVAVQDCESKAFPEVLEAVELFNLFVDKNKNKKRGPGERIIYNHE